MAKTYLQLGSRLLSRRYENAVGQTEAVEIWLARMTPSERNEFREGQMLALNILLSLSLVVLGAVLFLL